MTNTNGKVSWRTFIFIGAIIIAVIGTLWTKLEKIDDSLGEVKIDLAVIKTIIMKTQVNN